MFPSRLNPSALNTPTFEQGESSQNPSSPSTSAAQQIAQHLQQAGGQNSPLEAVLGDSAQPVQHITAEHTRKQQLSNVLQAWVDQMPPSEKKEGRTQSKALLKKASGTKKLVLTIRIGQSFPDVFPFFEKLETLEVTTHHGTLPDSLSQLKELKDLTISSDTHTLLPNSLEQLTSLESLTLHNFKKLPPLPQEVAQLKKLSSLSISFCGASTPLPENTHLIPQLKKVFLNNCASAGDAIEELRVHQRLNELWVYQTPLNAKHLMVITTFKNLSVLGICANPEMTELPEELFELSELTALTLSHNDLLQIPEALGKLEKLKILSFENNRAITTLPNSIGLLRNLQTLDLEDCARLQMLPETIVDLPSACQIQMEGAGLSVNVLQQLSRQTELRRQSSNGLCGPTVHFSLPAHATRPVRTLQEEALEWMREAGNNHGLHPVAQKHIAQLDADSAKALATLLVRFKHTAQYTHAPMNTAQRIHAMLNELFAYPKLLDSFCAMALESTTTCDDRTALGMLHMELALLENRLVRAIQEYPSSEQALEAIKKIGLGVFKQKHLMDFAHEHAKQAKGFVDETEIVLKFFTKLGKKLALPTQLDHMLYADCAWQVKSEDLEKAEHQITEQANLDHPAFLDFLASWHPMQEALQTHFPGLWRDLEHQCDNIDTATLEAIEQQNTAYETACEQYGEESPQALDWQTTINQTNETRQTKRAAVWRAAIQEALNAPAETDQAGPSKKPKFHHFF